MSKKGEPVTVDYFIKMLYRDTFNDSKSRKEQVKVFLIKESLDRKRYITSYDDFLNRYQQYTYFTVNSFWHHRHRELDKMLWINAIVLDFDFAKDGTNRSFNPDSLYDYIYKKTGLRPFFIWETKTRGNFQVAFLIKQISATEKQVAMISHIQRKLAIQLGADTMATNPNQPFRIPRRGLWLFDSEIYKIDTFKKISWNIKIKKKELVHGKTTPNVHAVTEQMIWSHPAVQCLLKAEFNDSRNNAAFTTALFFYALRKPFQECLEFMTGEWFERIQARRREFNHALKLKEVEKAVHNAYSGKYKGPRWEYILDITGIYFEYIVTHSTYVSQNKYIKGEVVRHAIISFLKCHDREIKISQAELSEEIGMPSTSVDRNLKMLIAEGIVEKEAKRGRNGGTTLRLLNNDKKLENSHDNHQMKEENKNTPISSTYYSPTLVGVEDTSINKDICTRIIDITPILNKSLNLGEMKKISNEGIFSLFRDKYSSELDLFQALCSYYNWVFEEEWEYYFDWYRGECENSCIDHSINNWFFARLEYDKRIDKLNKNLGG